jgi:hypothetical protein
MMTAEVTTGPTFRVGQPRRLFEDRYVKSTGLWANYDVSLDGQRFLMVKPVGDFRSPAQITIVLNWSEELKQKVPTR